MMGYLGRKSILHAVLSFASQAAAALSGRLCSPDAILTMAIGGDKAPLNFRALGDGAAALCAVGGGEPGRLGGAEPNAVVWAPARRIGASCP